MRIELHYRLTLNPTSKVGYLRLSQRDSNAACKMKIIAKDQNLGASRKGSLCAMTAHSLQRYGVASEHQPGVPCDTEKTMAARLLLSNHLLEYAESPDQRHGCCIVLQSGPMPSSWFIVLLAWVSSTHGVCPTFLNVDELTRRHGVRR